VKLSLVRDFPADNAVALREALSRFERNVDAVVREADVLLERPRGVVPIVISDGATALPGIMNRFDTSVASLGAFLPSAVRVALQTILVIKTSASNTLTLTPVGGLINGASSLAITAVGPRLIYCDGAGFWA
jgi:hypothetical protein